MVNHFLRSCTLHFLSMTFALCPSSFQNSFLASCSLCHSGEPVQPASPLLPLLYPKISSNSPWDLFIFLIYFLILCIPNAILLYCDFHKVFEILIDT